MAMKEVCRWVRVGAFHRDTDRVSQQIRADGCDARWMHCHLECIAVDSRSTGKSSPRSALCVDLGPSGPTDTAHPFWKDRQPLQKVRGTPQPCFAEHGWGSATQ